MAAIRVSRTITGRELIVMFAGSYHGIFDEVLARPLVQNGELRWIPPSPRAYPETAQHRILVLEYGHPESLEIVRRHGTDIAAVLVEPVPSRRPDIAPVEFVQQLRQITRESGTALIFDEVVLGFRTHPRGARRLPWRRCRSRGLRESHRRRSAVGNPGRQAGVHRTGRRTVALRGQIGPGSGCHLFCRNVHPQSADAGGLQGGSG